jgi:hypothetical protein
MPTAPRRTRVAETLTDQGQAEVAPAVRTVRISFRSVDSLIAYGIILAVVAWRSWAVLQWTFQRDDWRYISAAARLPFFDFITTQYAGHLQVGQFALVWLVSRAAPLDYVVAVLPVLAVTALGGVLIWKFLEALFGERSGNLVPLAVFMLCPLSTRSTLWWAASLQTIFLQVFIVASLFAALLYVRAPSWKRLSVVVLAYAGALLFWEKALLILPLMALFVVLFLGPGRGWSRIRRVTIGLWRMWLALTAITVPYVTWYFSVASAQLTYHPTATQIRRLSLDSFDYAVIPSYLGGPWRAPSVGRAAVYQLPLAARTLVLLAFAAIVTTSLLLLRQAWRAWVLPFAYIGMTLGLVATSRIGVVGPIVGLDARYTADSVPIFALALGLAFMVPKDRERDRKWSKRSLVFEIGSGPRRWSLGGPAPRVMGMSPTATRRALALSLVAAYAVSAMITNAGLAGLASKYSIKDWLANVRTSIDARPDASIVDDYLPPQASPLRALISDSVALSRVLAPIAQHVRWNAPSDSMYMFDHQGHLRPAALDSKGMANPGPVHHCGYPLNASHPHARARLPVPLPERRRWGVQLGYFSEKGATGEVTIDGDQQFVTFLPGLNPLFLVHRGAVSSVDLEVTDNPVCVSYVRVGILHPASETVGTAT